MKYKVCDKCGEIVAKTGFISSSNSKMASHFAKCNNKNCGKIFSRIEYEKLAMKDF